MITARLLVKSHRKGMSDKDGNSAAITLGIVSPMITQKATMPPKALKERQSVLALLEVRLCIQCPLGDGNRNKSGCAKAVLHSSIECKHLMSCHERMCRHTPLE